MAEESRDTLDLTYGGSSGSTADTLSHMITDQMAAIRSHQSINSGTELLDRLLGKTGVSDMDIGAAGAIDLGSAPAYAVNPYTVPTLSGAVPGAPSIGGAAPSVNTPTGGDKLSGLAPYLGDISKLVDLLSSVNVDDLINVVRNATGISTKFDSAISDTSGVTGTPVEDREVPGDAMMSDLTWGEGSGGGGGGATPLSGGIITSEKTTFGVDPLMGTILTRGVE